jgi:N-acetylglutamate synthase-like GNAT family acetyltransferase
MTSRPTLSVRQSTPEDCEWKLQYLTAAWGSHYIVNRGEIHDAVTLPSLIAERDGMPLGLATFEMGTDACALITLNAVEPNQGIGSSLLDQLTELARAHGCRRVWLVVTNDNTAALCFYQRRGFAIAALHRNAMEDARKLKPEIPLLGNNGIPIRDELELERLILP